MNTIKKNNRKNITKEPLQSDKDSVETYKDLTKLIITLSTGTFVLSPAFLGLIKFEKMKYFIHLYISWSSLLLSIIFGLFVLSSLAGTQHMNKYDIDNPITKWFSRLQWFMFVVGILFFGIFVGKNLFYVCIK